MIADHQGRSIFGADGCHRRVDHGANFGLRDCRTCIRTEIYIHVFDAPAVGEERLRIAEARAVRSLAGVGDDRFVAFTEAMLDVKSAMVLTVGPAALKV